MLNYFIFGLSYAFACVVQPGPFQALLFSQSVTKGWRKTIPLVFVPLLSDLPVIILVLFALSNVPAEILYGLQCVGGVFLLYLSYKAYKNWQSFDTNPEPEVFPKLSIFKAVLINILNPNPYLAWSLIMGPKLINAWNENPLNGILLLLGFYGSMIIYSIGLIVLFASARNLGQRVNRIAIGISVIAFVLFGIYQLWSGIAAFII